MFRSEVLSLYRRIFRVARQWQATTAADTEAERQYIKDEARKLFHKNKEVSIKTYIVMYIGVCFHVRLQLFLSLGIYLCRDTY